MRKTGIDLLAADLGTTPEGVAIAIGVIGALIIVLVAVACWKLSQAPPAEGWPDDPRPTRPGPALPRGSNDSRAA